MGAAPSSALLGWASNTMENKPEFLVIPIKKTIPDPSLGDNQIPAQSEWNRQLHRA